MSKYQVIAKRFRPSRFQDVLSQEGIVTTLKNAIRLERIGHAYLFCGSRGSGKTTLARLFAKAINCENLSDEQEPCNSCSSCKEITGGHSLDVIEIDGASNRGIDAIRSLNETVGYAASSGRFKVYIIDEVHMLTKEAFNALLKTLEEPPKHVLFFFATTEPHQVLPTIISRCQRFDLKRISFENITLKLSSILETLGIEAEKEALALIAESSEGSLRDAESLLDQVICYHDAPIKGEHVAKTLGLAPKKIYFALDEAVLSGNLAAAFDLSQELFEEGAHLIHFMEGLLAHFRNLLLIHLGKAPFATSKEELNRYKHSAAVYSKGQLLTILDDLTEELKELQQSPFKRLSVEMVLLRILRSVKQLPLEALAEELIALKGEILSGKAVEPKVPEPVNMEAELQKKMHHERLLRFASVELQGTLRK